MQPSPASMLAILCYARFDAPAVLAHERRRDILELVQARVSLRVGDVAHALGVDYKTALHHVRVLARAGFVSVRHEGRARICALPGTRRGEP